MSIVLGHSQQHFIWIKRTGLACIQLLVITIGSSHEICWQTPVFAHERTMGLESWRESMCAWILSFWRPFELIPYKDNNQCGHECLLGVHLENNLWRRPFLLVRCAKVLTRCWCTTKPPKCRISHSCSIEGGLIREDRPLFIEIVYL